MREILEAIYIAAAEQPNHSRWLFDDKAAQDLSACSLRAERACEQLRARLTGEDLALFEAYVQHTLSWNCYEQTILFNHALAIGISLGALDS